MTLPRTVRGTHVLPLAMFVGPSSWSRLLAGLLVGCSVSVAARAAGVSSHGVLRFVPVFCIAPVAPILVACIAQTHGGVAIGSAVSR